MQIWRDDVNKAAGSSVVGRAIYYDDRRTATVPGIYTSSSDVDKVDLVVSGTGPTSSPPAMPSSIERQSSSWACSA